MIDGLPLKVVLEQRVLHGSNSAEALQRVAAVYVSGKEYRVSAPPRAKGDALDWIPHFAVRVLDGPNSEIEIPDPERSSVLNFVRQELERHKRDVNRALGMNPDGEHCDAQICLRGHVVHCDGTPFRSEAYCTKCGARCIDECPQCQEPIHGMSTYGVAPYSKPHFCHKCGHAYPWMEERLRTARELLENDDKLSPEDRENVWKDLGYVMSDPRSDLSPAKRKLIEVRLEHASKYVREFVLDLTAKIAAEMLKP